MKMCVFVFVFLFPLQAFAQPTLSTDSRVRITAPTLYSKPFTGNIARIVPDTLLLKPRTRIPLQAISKLEVSLGVTPLGKRVVSKAWKGALFVGGLVSVALMENWDDWDGRSGNKALLTILGGGLAGGTMGGIWGALHHPEHWETIPPASLNTYLPPVFRTQP